MGSNIFYHLSEGVLGIFITCSRGSQALFSTFLGSYQFVDNIFIAVYLTSKRCCVLKIHKGSLDKKVKLCNLFKHSLPHNTCFFTFYYCTFCTFCQKTALWVCTLKQGVGCNEVSSKMGGVHKFDELWGG